MTTAIMPMRRELLGLDEPEPLELALKDHMELVDGELLEKPPMAKINAKVTLWLGSDVLRFVADEGLGEVLSESASYKCFPHKPNQTRRPDLSFIVEGRSTPEMDRGHIPICPDLVVEVISPNDETLDSLARVEDFLAAGTRLVWMVIPEHHMAFIYRADGSVERLRAADSLDGEDVLPGLSLPLAELFKRAGVRRGEAKSDPPRVR